MSYDPLNPNAIELVRILCGDLAEPQHYSDPQIAVMLTEVMKLGASANGAPYCAAAQLGESMAAAWRSAGKGVVEKSVSKLSITYGESGYSAYRDYLSGLRATCQTLSLAQPAVLRAL